VVRVFSFLTLGVAVGLGLVSLTSSGQTTFGSIFGAVSDSTGAATPGAQVILTNIATSERRTAITSTDGTYRFVNLDPGRYRLEVEKPGFKRFAREPVVVEVQSSIRIDVTLEVGAVTETVEVTAETPLLQPQTSSLGGVVGQRQVNELPLNGRNPLNLVALVPSVVPQGQSLQNPTGTNIFAWGNYQIGGGMANQSATYLDGAPLNVSYANLMSLVPTQDSVQEFKVQTNGLSAEFGRFAGGVINLTTKTGSNTLHGSLWEFLRNKDLNANTFFNNRSGIGRPPFTQNQFGGNAGGPVYIPGLYDGRNKTFWFFNYEGFRQRQGQAFLLTVPTADLRAGDFSNLRDANGNLVPIFDATTTRPDPARPGFYLRDAFPGNAIPQSRLDGAAVKMTRLWAQPNGPGAPFTHVGNFATNSSVGGNNDQYVARIDQNIGDKHRIFARYTYWSNLNLPIDPYGTGVCKDRCTETFTNNSFVVDEVYTVSPTTVLDLRANYTRFSYDRTPKTLGFDVSSLGWPASLNSQVAFRVLPVPVVTGYDDSNVFGSQGAGSVIIDRNDDQRIAGSLTKIRGAHTFKFGGEYRRDTHNYAQTNVPTGIFYFNQNFTASDPLHPVGGNGFASFLLGYGSSGNASTPALVAGAQHYGALYFEDTLQVSSRLTFILGVRYDMNRPWTERFDRLSFFTLDSPNPLTANTALPAKGRLGLVHSSERSSRSSMNFDSKQFAPRIGLAYRVTSRTVVRTGYGIFWLPNNIAWSQSPNNDVVNSIGTPFVNSRDGGLTPFDKLSNPFPNGIIQPPGRDPRFQNVVLGQGITVTVPATTRYAYAQQWNFNIQHEFPGNLLVDVAYAGAKGTRLQCCTYNQQIDQLPDQYLSLGTALLTQVPNPYYGQITAGALSGPTVPRGQLLRPYPEYNGLSIAGSTVGSSSYESLQIRVEKRFPQGGILMLSYTNSKLIANTDPISGWLESGGIGGIQNWNNLTLERSLASFDTPQRFVASYVLDLPVGRGHKLLSGVTGMADKLLTGWGIDGVTTFQRGFPLHPGTAQNLTNSFGGGSRPNKAAGDGGGLLTGSRQSRLNRWFNTSLFSQPAPFTFGNESRTDAVLRADGIRNFDFSAFKNTGFGKDGHYVLQFRAEFFNLFNTPQFDFPGQTFGTPQFGVVTSQANSPRLVQFALRLRF
jgi:hypothetical protein